jgi:thioredoxin reductase
VPELPENRNTEKVNGNIHTLFISGSDQESLICMEPVVDENFETNIPGLFLAGSIIEAPSIRVAANQGHRIANMIAKKKGSGPVEGGVMDLVIGGAGPAGLNAAFTAREHSLTFKIFDQYFMGATILAMPAGKIFDIHYKNVYDKPEGMLWYETSLAPKLHNKWVTQILGNNIEVNEHEAVRDVIVDRELGGFRITTTRGVYRSRCVLLAIGKSGYTRRLNVLGELQLHQAHRVHYKYRGDTRIHGKKILVIGGGNTATEAAIALSRTNDVTLSYRKKEFTRPSSKNLDSIKELEARGRIEILLNSNVLRYDKNKIVLYIDGKVVKREFDEYYVLIGYEIPMDFLRRIGVELR